MITRPPHKHGQSGSVLFLGTASLVFIIPLLGLSVDASFLYAAKGRLQAAVDGAALGAARALNLGTTLVSQQTNAAQNAVNWFYANFPPGTWLTSGTVMSSGSVTENDSSGFYSTSVNIYPDASNAQLDHVDVTASTSVPTWFMKWFGMGPTTLTAVSHATRRAAVVMMVLDRSGSMCSVNGVQKSQPCGEANATYSCAQMITAAKQFTGQFAEGRDYIGLVSFSSNTYVHVNSGGTTGVPDQSFQTTLGYTNSFGSGNGALDNLKCGGGTNTAEGVALGYQLLYQAGLPGALNILFLETDGLPNSLALNFYDSSAPAANRIGLVKGTTAMNGSQCKDTANQNYYQGGFGSSAVIPSWNGFSLNLQAAPFATTAGPYSNVPSSMIGVVYTDDPGGSNQFSVLYHPWSNTAAQTPQKTTNTYNTNSTISGNGNCAFNGGQSGVSYSSLDFSWFPATDVFANQLNPSTNPYKSVTTDANGHILNNGWTNFHNAALNATDNSAYVARANTTDPAYVFAIGLGGNSVNGPPDPILLQRMANDPTGDTFNASAYYDPCASETGCVTYSGQLQGTFVYAPSSAELASAFLKISSQILRLAK